MEGPWVKYFFEITSKEEEEEEELYLLIPSLPPSILEFYFFSLPLSLSTSSTTCFRFPLPISLSTYLSLYLSLSTSLFLPLSLPSLHSYHQFSFFFSSPFSQNYFTTRTSWLNTILSYYRFKCQTCPPNDKKLFTISHVRMYKVGVKTDSYWKTQRLDRVPTLSFDRQKVEIIWKKWKY